MKIVPFERDHLRRMVIQQRQHLEQNLNDEILTAMEKQGDSFTAIDNDEIIACAGTLGLSHGRALAWSYISENIGNRLIGVTNSIKRYLDIAGHRRIEMDVDCDFAQAHRWAQMLGFTKECDRRKSLYVEGQDCALYARVK